MNSNIYEGSGDIWVNNISAVLAKCQCGGFFLFSCDDFLVAYVIIDEDNCSVQDKILVVVRGKVIRA